MSAPASWTRRGRTRRSVPSTAMANGPPTGRAASGRRPRGATARRDRPGAVPTAAGGRCESASRASADCVTQHARDQRYERLSGRRPWERTPAVHGWNVRFLTDRRLGAEPPADYVIARNEPPSGSILPPSDRGRRLGRRLRSSLFPARCRGPGSGIRGEGPSVRIGAWKSSGTAGPASACVGGMPS
jgi:hypothetical protein